VSIRSAIIATTWMCSQTGPTLGILDGHYKRVSGAGHRLNRGHEWMRDYPAAIDVTTIHRTEGGSGVLVMPPNPNGGGFFGCTASDGCLFRKRRRCMDARRLSRL
jgi:hypothetical protein